MTTIPDDGIGDAQLVGGKDTQAYMMWKYRHSTQYILYIYIVHTENTSLNTRKQ